MHNLTIAVDFDGTLTTKSAFPDVGTPNKVLIDVLKDLKRCGADIILWTCREGKYLDDAVKMCEDMGLTFNAINDNVSSVKERFKGNSRKVVADYYIDDHSITPKSFVKEFRVR